MLKAGHSKKVVAGRRLKLSCKVRLLFKPKHWNVDLVKSEMLICKIWNVEKRNVNCRWQTKCSHGRRSRGIRTALSSLHKTLVSPSPPKSMSLYQPPRNMCPWKLSIAKDGKALVVTFCCPIISFQLTSQTRASGDVGMLHRMIIRERFHKKRKTRYKC